MLGGDNAVLNNDEALVEVDVDADRSSPDDSDEVDDEIGDDEYSSEIIVNDDDDDDDHVLVDYLCLGAGTPTSNNNNAIGCRALQIGFCCIIWRKSLTQRL